MVLRIKYIEYKRHLFINVPVHKIQILIHDHYIFEAFTRIYACHAVRVFSEVVVITFYCIS